jgi:hypothetical protein
MPLKKINFIPKGKSRLSIHLTFQTGQFRPSNVEFELSADEAMTLLAALQVAQRRNRWRIPPWPGRVEKPVLRVVKDDE